jgi:Peptidase M50B-like
MHSNDELIEVPGGCCESALEQMPDACSNDERQEALLLRQQKDDRRSAIRRFFERERNLLIACVILVVAMNFTEGQYVLYPFKIFSTWVHEMCHGFAAILMGGGISEVNIFKDGSGLAYTSSSGTWQRGFIASAGYPGTAVTGCLLLLYRRTTLGPTIGTIGIGLCMIFTCILWVRGTFGLAMILSEGAFLVLAGWKLPAHFVDNLFNFLAATCCLNAVESINDLFAVGSYVVGGEEVTSSDAHTVAEKWGLDYRFWAWTWLCMSVVLTIAGIVFARDARATRWMKAPAEAGGAATSSSNYYLPEVSVAPRRDVERGDTAHTTAVVY